MNRKKFIESQGATCQNWTWSWSFVNSKNKVIIFGAWDSNTEGDTSLIFSERWKTNYKGRKQPAYDQSREHIRLIEEEGYQLKTFPLILSDEKQDEHGYGPATIKSFTPKLSPKILKRIGDDWYASDRVITSRLPDEVTGPMRTHRNTKVLLARVGFMKFYQGPKVGDEKPIGGGAYNAEEIGHEAYNFLNIRGTLYGYFQPHMKPGEEINLGRIEHGCDDDKIDNVLVIWFATNPIDRGQVVIGWYNNATVYRSMQSPNSLPLRKNYNYNIKARKEDCVLLPISKRKFPVGHDIKGTKMGNPGQANAFYLLDAKGQAKDLRNPNNAWITKLIEYVEKYDGSKISTREDEIQEDALTAQYSSGGQGFQSDVEVRLMIEAHAMNICKIYYFDQQFDVKDVSANSPYDIVIKKNGFSRLVEVKGTQTAGDTIILTKNEVELSRSKGDNMVLFIVHSIVMNNKKIKKGSGVISIIEPWQVSDDRLTPISFTYKLS